MNTLPANLQNLTFRECQALDELITHGCNKPAAKQMGVSIRTLELHLSRAYRKMDVSNRIQAVLTWDRFKREMAAA